jgi:hypothetical protein
MTDVPAVDSATLQRWLAEARQALHELNIGRRAIRLNHGTNQKGVEYQRADRAALRAYIARLEAQIAGGGAPSGISIVF